MKKAARGRKLTSVKFASKKFTCFGKRVKVRKGRKAARVFCAVAHDAAPRAARKSKMSRAQSNAMRALMHSSAPATFEGLRRRRSRR